MESSPRVVIDYTDDMTGLAISEEKVDRKFRFSVDGINFKMDTDVDLANEVRELLSRAAANAEIEYYKAKIVEPKPRRKPTNPEHSRLLKKIRYWANANSKKAASRGRIPEGIVKSYRTANPGVDMTPVRQQ